MIAVTFGPTPYAVRSVRPSESPGVCIHITTTVGQCHCHATAWRIDHPARPDGQLLHTTAGRSIPRTVPHITVPYINLGLRVGCAFPDGGSLFGWPIVCSSGANSQLPSPHLTPLELRGEGDHDAHHPAVVERCGGRDGFLYSGRKKTSVGPRCTGRTKCRRSRRV